MRKAWSGSDLLIMTGPVLSSALNKGAGMRRVLKTLLKKYSNSFLLDVEQLPVDSFKESEHQLKLKDVILGRAAVGVSISIGIWGVR